jgi:hypothetical protein
VQFARPVNLEANQELVSLEKRSPCVVEQHTVGLERVADGLPVRVVLLDFNQLPKMLHPGKRWLAAMQSL